MHLGVDIGGTNARVALVDGVGRVIASERAALSDRSVDGVTQAVVALVKRLDESASLAPIGVGIAGMLDGQVVVNAPNLGWRDVPFGAHLHRALNRPVRLVNDLSAAAWGERMAGVARGASDTFTVFVGTGVGSAIISAGVLVHGASGVAGEFGHVKVVARGGRRCGCGEDGCLEAYAGGAKLTEWMREVGLEGGVNDLEQAAASDARAFELYDFAVSALSLAIANQVTVLNPKLVVLGGGVLMRCPGIVQRIRDTIDARSGRAARVGLEVKLASLGDDSGLVGAALLGAS